MEITSFCLYDKLHPKLKLSQLEFLRSLMKQYIQNQRATLATPDVAPHFVEMETNSHYLMSTSQVVANIVRKTQQKNVKYANMLSAIPSVNIVQR